GVVDALVELPADLTRVPIDHALQHVDLRALVRPPQIVFGPVPERDLFLFAMPIFLDALRLVVHGVEEHVLELFLPDHLVDDAAPQLGQHSFPITRSHGGDAGAEGYGASTSTS